jgi:cephalosporin-C deacetylase
MQFDMPLGELRRYLPEIEEPPDFDQFWSQQLTEARSYHSEPVFAATEAPVRHAEVFDVTYAGHGGHAVRGWLLVPHEVVDNAPLVVEYVGYNGGRGDPLDSLAWSCAGYPHFVMDNRGQGGGWRGADTPDPGDSGAPSSPGFLTRGIADPGRYYYTRLFVDATRAIDAVRLHPCAGGRKIVTTGGSQGGGLALATAHLVPAVQAVMPDVPFLAHPRRALEVADSHPYLELAQYCGVYSHMVERVFTTLSYIDVVNHAKRANVPALFSVGLTDQVTPPSTVFAAFNHYAGPKEIAVYPYNGHEGGGTYHFRRKLDFLAGLGSNAR